MTTFFRLAVAIFALIAGAILASAAPPTKPGPAPLTKPAADRPGLDFSMPAAVLDLKSGLSPYNAPAAHEDDGSKWYLLTASNQSVRPVQRILLATDPANAALQFFPRHARPEIWQVASSDSGVTVERVHALGHHAYEVTIPPATQVSLALRVAYGDALPSIQAWTVPALVAHNRQLAIFLAAVAGLIAAALAIMAGVAVVTAHPAPAWTALVLLLVMLTRLQGAGVLDAGWVTAVGGPYGLSAMLSGLAVAAALYLTDLVAPVVDLWPAMEGRRRWVFAVVIAVSALAFVGAPGAIVATQFIVLVGTAGITTYLVHRGLKGSKAARVVAPSAAIFALVAAITAAIELGAFGGNPMAAGIVAGFMAAGSVLLALAIAAGEGIAILPIARRHIEPAGASPSQAAGEAEARSGSEPLSSSVSEAVAAIGAAHQGVFDLDFASGRLKLSREAASLLGLSGAQNFGDEDWRARIHPDDREIYASALEDYRAHPGLSFRIEFRARAESGRYPWFELRATIKRGGDGTHCLGLMADITTRKELELASHDRSLQDPLTGLGNRVALLQELENVGAKWSDVAFLLLDIDRFKSIHASLGDTGGDQLLLGLASRLAKRFDNTGRAFRTGGDSFAIVVPGGAASVQKSTAELIEICHTPYSVAGRNVFASATIGAATGRDADDPLELIRNAELALGLAKRQGGGCAKLFTRDLESETRGDAVALETDLRRGLSQNEFAVYYQPIVRLTDGTVAGFEALLRWQHPQKGLVSPADFIAHSEETGLIVALGRFALERTASALADWQRYFPLSPPLFASVNVSRRQLLDENLESCLKHLFAAGKFAAGSLKLEITESAVETGADAKPILERLRGMGAVLAIDDFGTGMSSLSQLKDLPFETVKIDQSFLARRGSGKDDKDGSVVISSVVSLAHELKRDVVAEGVESEDDAEWLRDIGCDYAQGFFFSHPIPGEAVLKFIADHFRADEPEPVDTTSGAAGVG